MRSGLPPKFSILRQGYVAAATPSSSNSVVFKKTLPIAGEVGRHVVK